MLLEATERADEGLLKVIRFKTARQLSGNDDG